MLFKFLKSNTASLSPDYKFMVMKNHFIQDTLPTTNTQTDKHASLHIVTNSINICRVHAYPK